MCWGALAGLGLGLAAPGPTPTFFLSGSHRRRVARGVRVDEHKERPPAAGAIVLGCHCY